MTGPVGTGVPPGAAAGKPRIVQIGSLFGAATILLLGLTHSAFKDPEGLLDGAVALPLGVAVALVVLSVTTATEGWSRAGRWAALALAGEGAVLTLVDAGNLISYQHLRLWTDTPGGVGALALLVLVAQATCLSVWGRATLVRATRRALQTLGVGRLFIVLTLFVLSSAALSADVTVYVSELLWASLLQGLQLWCIVLTADSIDARAGNGWGPGLRRFFLGENGDEGGGAPVGLALWTVVVTGLLSWFSYQRHPHVPDEVVYILHARYFAAGLLELPVPPVPAAFDLDLMTLDPERWFSPVLPGWPAALAVGVALGVPWLVNPVLAGLSVLLAHAVVRRLYGDDRVARLTAVLMAVSPWFLFISMSFMSHAFTLFTALLAAWAVARLVHGGHWAWSLLGGAGIGLVSLNRPLEGLIVAGLLGLWSLLATGVPIRAAVGRTVTLALATISVAAITFPYNRHFTGSAGRFPIMDYTDRVYGAGANALGFGPQRGLGWPGLDPFPGHGLIDVFVNGSLNVFQLNVELLGWGMGSILVLAMFVFGRSLAKADWMMLAVVATVVAAHSFYWFSGGPDFGARYWYLILVPCLALAARSLLQIAGSERAGLRVWPALGVLVLAVVFVFLPWRAIDKYHHYRGMRPDIRHLVADGTFGEDALVLIRGDRHPDYASAAIYNPLDLTGPGPIIAWDRSDEARADVLRNYSDRSVWLVDGPTVTGQGFRVIAGPLDPAEVTRD